MKAGGAGGGNFLPKKVSSPRLCGWIVLLRRSERERAPRIFLPGTDAGLFAARCRSTASRRRKRSAVIGAQRATDGERFPPRAAWMRAWGAQASPEGERWAVRRVRYRQEAVRALWRFPRRPTLGVRGVRPPHNAVTKAGGRSDRLRGSAVVHQRRREGVRITSTFSVGSRLFCTKCLRVLEGVAGLAHFRDRVSISRRTPHCYDTTCSTCYRLTPLNGNLGNFGLFLLPPSCHRPKLPLAFVFALALGVVCFVPCA